MYRHTHTILDRRVTASVDSRAVILQMSLDRRHMEPQQHKSAGRKEKTTTTKSANLFWISYFLFCARYCATHWSMGINKHMIPALRPLLVQRKTETSKLITVHCKSCHIERRHLLPQSISNTQKSGRLTDWMENYGIMAVTLALGFQAWFHL